MRDGDGELDGIKHQMVSLSTDHITFGHGRHAWSVAHDCYHSFDDISEAFWFSVLDVFLRSMRSKRCSHTYSWSMIYSWRMGLRAGQRIFRLKTELCRTWGQESCSGNEWPISTSSMYVLLLRLRVFLFYDLKRLPTILEWCLRALWLEKWDNWSSLP